MGGYGSGRQGGKPIAEEALQIDLAWMLRNGRAQAGVRLIGGLSWTCRGEPSGNIAYTCDMRDAENSTLELRFTVTRRSAGEAKDHIQHIRLSYTQPNFGGKRWWMHCPVNGGRVGKLFVPAGAELFASRRAWGMGYRSQRVTARDAAFERLFNLQRRLECPIGWEMPIRRPKGMWHRTYRQLEREYWELDHHCSRHMMAVAEQLQASLKWAILEERKLAAGG